MNPSVFLNFAENNTSEIEFLRFCSIKLTFSILSVEGNNKVLIFSGKCVSKNSLATIGYSKAFRNNSSCFSLFGINFYSCTLL
jgi:hypothetical protein